MTENAQRNREAEVNLLAAARPIRYNYFHERMTNA